MKAFKKPKLEVADVFLKHGHELPALPIQTQKVISAIKNCRTEKLGGHIRKCDQCDHKEISYNSCRNRHCGKCQFLAKAKWIDKRLEELLPCQYFHVVFTLPAELRPLILRNKKEMYNLLFKASADTLKEVAQNPKNMGADLGFIGVLHTWGQSLIDHAHIHYIVPGGGLDSEKSRWIGCKSNFLLPVKILSKVFRGKFLSGLEEIHRMKNLKFVGQIEVLSNDSEFKALLREASNKNWLVYSKKPFQGAKSVVNYLGQYTHRIAISNQRLIKMENGKVQFKYRDYADDNKSKVIELTASEFMRRYLLHVLPHGFMRIRHFGLFANRCKKQNLQLCREILKVIVKAIGDKIIESWQKVIERHIGIDITVCKKCKVGQMAIAGMLPATLNTS